MLVPVLMLVLALIPRLITRIRLMVLFILWYMRIATLALSAAST